MKTMDPWPPIGGVITLSEDKMIKMKKFARDYILKVIDRHEKKGDKEYKQYRETQDSKEAPAESADK